MNHKTQVAFVIILLLSAGCTTTGSNLSAPQPPTVTNSVSGSPDPNFMGAGANRAIDKDEEELRLVP